VLRRLRIPAPLLGLLDSATAHPEIGDEVKKHPFAYAVLFVLIPVDAVFLVVGGVAVLLPLALQFLALLYIGSSDNKASRRT